MIKKLGEDLPDVAIQRTDGKETKKGYDTTGYAYQYCVDRFNDVCGEGWGYWYELVHHEQGAYNSGAPFHDITVNVFIWINTKETARMAPGGHRSSLHVDALKGAFTNGFKKCAGFWGVGAKAYRGEIDDDNCPLPDSHVNVKNSNPVMEEKQKEKKACPKCGAKAIIKGKPEYGGGYVCWKKATTPGCGQKFLSDMTEAISKSKEASNIFFSNVPQEVNLFLKTMGDKDKYYFCQNHKWDNGLLMATIRDMENNFDELKPASNLFESDPEKIIPF
jgi:DNA-directed RNA polymerase subunit RPC12/RpoP